MAHSHQQPLEQRSLSYGFVGATRIDAAEWQPPPGPRSFQRSVVLGHGDARWITAGQDVLTWKVKTRSGFTVVGASAGPASAGERLWLKARLGLLTVREPVEVIAVVQTDDRCGLAYGTLEGQPVSGEEAFIVSRDSAGTVTLTIRSLTEPGHGRWRAAWPAVRVAQRVYRGRYLRALSDGRAGPTRP